MNKKQKLLFLITSVLCMVVSPFLGIVSTPSVAYGSGSPCYFDGKQYSSGAQATNNCGAGSAQLCNDGTWDACQPQ